MAVYFGPNPEVTSGLIVQLDATIKASYPGIGTTWYDLSGYRNHATLVNGPTFNSEKGGSIVFDGIDDIVNSIDASSLTEMTIEIWLYDVRSGQKDILTYNNDLGSYTFTGSSFRTDGDFLPARFFTIDQETPNSQWYRFCYVKNGNLYINNKKYTGSGSDRTYGILSFGNTRAGINYRLNGKISSIKIYNRSLTDFEILQNYNARRGLYYS